MRALEDTSGHKMKKVLVIVLIFSHLLMGAAGFGLGIYLLPILIAPESPSMSEINEISMNAEFSGKLH